LQEIHPRWLRGLRVRGFLAGAAAAGASAFILVVLFQEGPARAGDKKATFSERPAAEDRGGVTSLRIRACAVGATVLVQSAGGARMGDGRVRRRGSSFG
jgi:ABC-type uncharacterized transport system permease subunit